jgi:hypothetical protein
LCFATRAWFTSSSLHAPELPLSQLSLVQWLRTKRLRSPHSRERPRLSGWRILWQISKERPRRMLLHHAVQSLTVRASLAIPETTRLPPTTQDVRRLQLWLLWLGSVMILGNQLSRKPASGLWKVMPTIFPRDMADLLVWSLCQSLE